MCAIFLDLRKAFDSVPHQLLLDKLESSGLSANILAWVRSYLTGRQQHVVVGGASSQDIPVLSGVPQGSVLGPLLFLLYIDDVSYVSLSDGSVLNLFADDKLLYKPINSASDLQCLQSDINKISEWVDHNHLKLNPSKCKCMLVSRKRRPAQPLSFLLSGATIEQVETFKYLGVHLSSNLTWSSHIHSICAKARKLTGLLYRRFYTGVESRNLLEMYKLLICPHLEYAAPVWDPHLSKDISMMENVQKFALRMCLKNWDTGYQDLLDLTNFPSLKNRRLYLKLSTLYKIIYGLFYFPP